MLQDHASRRLLHPVTLMAAFYKPLDVMKSQGGNLAEIRQDHLKIRTDVKSQSFFVI